MYMIRTVTDLKGMRCPFEGKRYHTLGAARTELETLGFHKLCDADDVDPETWGTTGPCTLGTGLPKDEVEIHAVPGYHRTVTPAVRFSGRYLMNGGKCCPVCMSTKLVAGPLHPSAAEIWCDVTCLSCTSTWVETYKLHSVDAVFAAVEVK